MMKLQKNAIRQYPLTWLGLGVAILVAVLSDMFDLDPFDHLVRLFSSVEEYEIDELFIAGLIFLCFWVADLLRRQKKQKIEDEKIRVYTAMLASAHHILNNFLNQMQLFKITADNTPGFDKKVLALYDKIMDEASQQIRELGNITEINEKSIKDSVKPK